MAEIVWKEPWGPVNSDTPGLQIELERELSAAHPLWKRGARVIGRRGDNDDVVVSLNDGTFACVHLTWQGKIDGYPAAYPATVFYASLESLFEAKDGL